MNSWRKAAEFLRAAVDALDTEQDAAQRAALYGGLATIIGELETLVHEDCEGNTYALEKCGNFRWHVAAALGIDDDNGHGPAEHRRMALGELRSFENVLDQMR